MKRSMVEFMTDAEDWLHELFLSVTTWANITFYDTSEDDWEVINDERVETPTLVGATAFSSRLRDEGEPGDDDLHVVALDIDLRMMVLPSSTEGHGHLIFDQTCAWSSIVRLLDAMEECGLIGEGYVSASKQRKATFLRLPWITKGQEKEDAEAARREWLAADEVITQQERERFEAWLHSAFVGKPPAKRPRDVLESRIGRGIF